MRLIDADALIADCQLAQKQADIHGREFANAFYSEGCEISTEWWCVEDMIENAPTIEERKTGEWIPCSERLPEKDTCFYLATIANHGLNFTTTLPDDVDVIRWDYDRRKGHNSWHWCTERTVIAWMPLPAPYRKEGEK